MGDVLGVGGLDLAAAEMAWVCKDLTLGQGIVPAPQGEGSKELDTGLLPRKVGEKRQSVLCSLQDTGPMSPALPFHGHSARRLPTRASGMDTIPPPSVSRHSVLSRTAESGEDGPSQCRGLGGLRG